MEYIHFNDRLFYSLEKPFNIDIIWNIARIISLFFPYLIRVVKMRVKTELMMQIKQMQRDIPSLSIFLVLL